MQNDRTRWMALVVLCVGMLMIVLDATIVNVALPSIQADLGFGAGDLAWVVNAYLIAFGGLLLLAGRLGDLLGQRRVFLIGLAIFTFFLPNYLGHADNYIPANPLATPAHIVPEWYFWPFYAILRAFTVDFILPAKLWGVLAMFASILLLFFLPWLDKSPVRSGSYRPTFKMFFWILVIDVLVLGYCGGAPAEEPFVMISQVATIYYFAHFLIILPLLGLFERPTPMPNSIAESVLGHSVRGAAGMPVGAAAEPQAKG